LILSPFEWTIAKRYLLPGKGEAFIALVASISIGVVMLSVAMLVVVMSVMNGFRAELLDKIVGLNGHAIVQAYGGRMDDWENILQEVRQTPGVVRASPLIEQPLLTSFNGRVEAILVRGNTPQDIRNLSSKVVSGNIDELAPGARKVAIGIRLAENIVRASATPLPSSIRKDVPLHLAHCPDRSVTKWPQSSKSAFTTMTGPSWSCRCRTRKRSCYSAIPFR